MKLLSYVTAFTLAFSVQAWAQAEKPEAKARKPQADLEARHCLIWITNPEIIRCAEAYLPRPLRKPGDDERGDSQARRGVPMGRS